MSILDEILEVSNTILSKVRRIEAELFPLPNPGAGFSIRVTGRNDMAVTYEIDLPVFDPAAPDAADVETGKVELTVNGVAQTPIVTQKTDTVLTGLTGNLNDVVSGKFWWVDEEDGQVSATPATFPDTPLVVPDTILPPDPGAGFGIRVTGES